MDAKSTPYNFEQITKFKMMCYMYSVTVGNVVLFKKAFNL